MKKYERMLPRVFPGVAQLQVRDTKDVLVWDWSPSNAQQGSETATDDNLDIAWAEYIPGIQKRELPDGQIQFRATLRLKEFGPVGWLIAAYNTQPSVAMFFSPDVLRRSFADAQVFLQDDIELQSECDQLAVELTERYEELNLVYATKDQVEYFEEGQEALVTLVHNCADYLDVELATLICQERDIALHNATAAQSLTGVDEILGLLGGSVYDYVESQIQSLILNSPGDKDRKRAFGGRSENLLAYPVVDEQDTVIGILAVVARNDKHVFSNGDRNLLEVMAKKASRIIHTHHDSLTGLMNRSGFESVLLKSLASAQRKNFEHILLHIDIDQLHVVNDLMGFHEGDVLIRSVAKKLKTVLRDTDMLSRLTGGQFSALLPNCDSSQGQVVAEKVRSAIAELTVVSKQRSLDVSVCIGLAPVDRTTEGIVGVMAAAEMACKTAKEEGKDRVQLYEWDSATLIRRTEEIEWIGRVQQALRDDLFVLYCQPVVPILDPSAAQHFEILIRMRDYNGDILSPFMFLPAAERYQLMPMVDRWVIRHSLQSLGAIWNTIAGGNPVFCINLSGQSFSNPGFQKFIMDEITGAGIPPKNICFEITESAAISHIEDAVSFIKVLREFGCPFSLDDFGAGLSSFGYLKQLPVDYLKIDGSFVREITTDVFSRSMVEAICKIGKTMKLSIVAEFVGDEETTNVLRSMHVDYAQGFGVGKPAPLEDILTTLEQEANAASA
jgi:diguanylate cyclase (GGDEF)-like protein